jgi:streptogramin lyase
MRSGLASLGWLFAFVVVGVLVPICPSAMASAAGAAGPVAEASFHPGGEPLILASDGSGGIWYGGAAVYVVSDESEAEASVWHLPPGGRWTRIALPTEPVSRWPEYFAAGPNGVEWFLADTEVNKSVELGRVSASGGLSLSAIPIGRDAWLRGLAVDSRGALWSTESGRAGHRRIAGIVRIVPGGRVSVFRKGLMRGAIPENVAAGAGGTLWFLDAAGRVGHVLANGRIREFPIGRRDRGRRTAVRACPSDPRRRPVGVVRGWA